MNPVQIVVAQDLPMPFITALPQLERGFESGSTSDKRNSQELSPLGGWSGMIWLSVRWRGCWREKMWEVSGNYLLLPRPPGGDRKLELAAVPSGQTLRAAKQARAI